MWRKERKKKEKKETQRGKGNKMEIAREGLLNEALDHVMTDCLTENVGLG